MVIIYNILFLAIGLLFGALTIYLRAYFRYENKKEIDKCFSERAELKKETEQLKNKIKDLEEKIKQLKKELESAYREIAEKNKYLSEDKVIIERLAEVKQLSDKIGEILIDYDKETIKHLLEIYQKAKEEKEGENSEIKNNPNGKFF